MNVFRTSFSSRFHGSLVTVQILQKILSKSLLLSVMRQIHADIVEKLQLKFTVCKCDKTVKYILAKNILSKNINVVVDDANESNEDMEQFTSF